MSQRDLDESKLEESKPSEGLARAVLMHACLSSAHAVAALVAAQRERGRACLSCAVLCLSLSALQLALQVGMPLKRLATNARKETC